MKDIQFDIHYFYHILAMMLPLFLIFILFLSKPMKKLSNLLATWIETKMNLEIPFERKKFYERFVSVIVISFAFILPIFVFGDLKRFEFKESNIWVTTLPFGSSEVIEYNDLELLYMFDEDSEVVPNLRNGEKVIRIRFKDSSETLYYLRGLTNNKLAEKYYPIHVINPHLITTAKKHELYEGKFVKFINSLNYVIDQKYGK